MGLSGKALQKDAALALLTTLAICGKVLFPNERGLGVCPGVCGATGFDENAVKK
jgi:hypothetical protein